MDFVPWFFAVGLYSFLGLVVAQSSWDAFRRLMELPTRELETAEIFLMPSLFRFANAEQKVFHYDIARRDHHLLFGRFGQWPYYIFVIIGWPVKLLSAMCWLVIIMLRVAFGHPRFLWSDR